MLLVWHSRLLAYHGCGCRLDLYTNKFNIDMYFVYIISSPPEPFRRLIGELKGYPCSVVRPPTISNIFFSETACPIKAKLYVEPPWVGGTKVCSRHLGHMTKMAVTPIYCKNPSKIFFSGTSRPISTKLGK